MKRWPTTLAAAVFVALAAARAGAAEAPQGGEDGCRAVATAIAKDCADAKAPKDPAQPKVQESPFAEWCNQPLQQYGCSEIAGLLEDHLSHLPPAAAPTKAQKAAKAAAEARMQVARAAGKQIAMSDRRTATNKSGSAGQIDPVESLQPITLAGGALSLAGTRTGTQGVATITVNPLALASPESVTAGRLLDLSVVAPFNLESTMGDQLRFVGLRLRVNATAPISTKKLKAALVAFEQAAGKLAAGVEDILRQAPNPRACVEDIMVNGRVTAAACGQALDAGSAQTTSTISYAEVAAARREADGYYLGLDVRFDHGDPTAGGMMGADGTRLVGALAGGIRLEQGASWDVELRFRAGVDYFHARAGAVATPIDPVVAADWGGALLLSGHVTADTEKQRMAFGVGVEGRQSKDDAAAALVQTNFVNLNLMAVVPATSGGDLGIAVSIPINDSKVPRGTIVTFSTDLGLLDGSGPPRTAAN
jgi:hypothetical protein